MAYSRSFDIRSYELSPSAEVRLTSIANYLQELAYQHARKLGLGYDDLKNNGRLWVLSRMRIEMLTYPVWNDEVWIETWPSGIDRLFALRDFRITGKNGRLLGKASTAWLIIDLESRRIIRPGKLHDCFSSVIEEDRVFNTGLVKLDRPAQIRFEMKHKVGFSDLDILGHVNNVRYIEWCIDAALEYSKQRRNVAGIEINYLHEARLGNTVLIQIGEGPEEVMHFSGKDVESETEYFRARIVFGP